ncbi:Mus7/MMS22 family protein [Colletotrichum costaricense]|uniref:Mus7/MMS22 family protein n=1 Tax=Colletotrichum costaricense TaxID=1209916 RepID=A0AAJ0DUR2_9PEZI|nr:Mus7/MMS22 family protein [Colletotrichum costaricense]KAK1514197.1 Mus7/MMS22 family protein [Colletotrichum costaricense]
MANWKELGEVPDSDDELDFDSQDLESLPNPELPSKPTSDTLQTKDVRKSIWDVPESSQDTPADATTDRVATDRHHEVFKPIDGEPPSSPLSSVPDVDELDDPFNLDLDEPAAQVAPTTKTRTRYLPNDRDDSPDPLAGDDTVSTSYVRITAPEPEFPAENDTESLPPPKKSLAASSQPSQQSRQRRLAAQLFASSSPDAEVAAPLQQSNDGNTSPPRPLSVSSAASSVASPAPTQSRKQLRPAAIQRVESSNRDEEVARQVAVRYERSFRPRKPIQEHPYLIENAQYSKALKSHGIRPIRMPTEPAPRRQRPEEDSQEKDFEDDSQEPTADAPNGTTDESQFNGLDIPLSSSPQLMSSLSDSPLRTSSPKHRGGPSSQPSQGDTDNTSFSDVDDLPSLDKIHRDLLANRSAKKRKRGKGTATKAVVTQTAAPNAPSRPQFQQYDEIYGMLSSPSSSPEVQTTVINHLIDPTSLPTESNAGTVFSEGDDLPIVDGNMLSAPELQGRISVEREPPVFDLTVADMSDVEEDNGSGDVDAHSSSGEESEGRDDGREEVGAAIAKRMRGVLPASWLRLDQQANRPKPTQYQRPDDSPEKGPRRGVAVRRIGRSASSTAAAFLFDDSDDDVVTTQTPTRPSHNIQTVLPFERSEVTEISDDDDGGSVVEEDQVDHMLPSRKRQLTLKDFRQPAKRQKKNDRPSSTQPKKRGRPLKSALRTSGASRLDPFSKSRKSTLSNTRAVARAKSPPRLSILDVIEPDAPKFLKIAARAAHSKRHMGRSSPTHKSIRLATRKDNVDAGRVLQQWKGGKIRPRPGLQTKKPRPTGSSGRHPLTQLPSNVFSRGAVSSPKARSATQSDELRRETSTPLTPLPEAHSRIRQMSRSNSVTSQQTQDTRNRPAQLETDLTQQPGRVGFQAKKRALDALFKRNHSQSLSSRSAHLDSFLDDTSSVVSGHSLAAGGSPEPAAVKRPILKRPRKPVQPIQIDVTAAHFRHADDPMPTIELITPVETPKAAFNDNQLLGLGPFGTHYTQHFDIFPLDRGVFFHETTLIGSGRVSSIAYDQFPEKVWNYRPRISYSLGEMVLRWDSWTEQVSSEFGIVMDGILEQILRPSLSAEVTPNGKAAARFVLDYVQKAMSFTNDADAASFIARVSDVVKSFLTRFESEDVSDLAQRRELADVLSNVFLVVSYAVRLCQKSPALMTESFAMEALLRKTAETLVRSLLGIGLDDVTQLYDDLQTLRYRERGIRSDKFVAHAWVVLIKALEYLRIPRMTFWDVTYSCMIQPSVIRGMDSQEFENLWKKMFTLLPLCEFDDNGVVVSDRRHLVPLEGWNLPQQVLKRVFQLYRDNPRQSPSFNDYCRALVSRCHYLVDQWGWQKSSGIIGTIFDFFGSQNLSHLRNEEAFRSARFLDSLHLEPSLHVEPEDRCFHIFLKLVALAIKRLRQNGAINDIRNLVARTLPNHDRQYSKEQDVHQNDLAALRNHHDLLCTLFWAAPPDLRPGIHNLEKLVIPASSHKEACLINLRAWNQLARFVVHEESAASFNPLASWQANVFKQLLDQYNSAAADIQQQFLALSKDDSNNVSEDLMNSIVATNKAATMEIMLFSVKSSMEVVQYASSLELARLASSPYQLQQVFQHFSTLPADFPSTLLQASMTTLERLLGRIESVFNEADDSQDSMASRTLESEDAILMLDRELAAAFLSAARCLLSNQSLGKPGNSSVSTSCVEQSVVVSGMMIGLFVRCGMMDIGGSLLLLWLMVIIQPSHCLRFENQFGQQLQRQGYPFIPDKAGLVVNPGYAANRDFFEYAASWMRKSLHTADTASKKNMRSEFERVLNAVMNQMRADLQIMTADELQHPSYVKFVRNIISLIKAHGSDICPVQKFFLEVSKEYSPPMQDPQLQAALIQSYGFKLAEGDPRVPSTLFHFLLNNFKGALQRGRLPHEVVLLKGALENDAIMSFVLSKMLPAVLHATLSNVEAYAMLDVLCDALGLAIKSSPIPRQVSEDNMGCIAALVTTTLAWANALGRSMLSPEHVHVLRRITWLLNAFQPSLEAFSFMVTEPRGWDNVMSMLHWFSLLAQGAQEYLENQETPFIAASGLFRRLRTLNEIFTIQDTTVLTWSEHIGNDISRNWVTTGPLLTVSPHNRGTPSTQSGIGSLRPKLRKSPSEGGAEDGKPPDKPAGEQEDGSRSKDGSISKTESVTAESAFRRSRGGAFASARARLSRPRAADELPPVKLPQSFLDNSVSLYDPENRINTLTNDLWHHRYMGARWHDLLWKDLDLVFSHASWSEAKLQDALRRGNLEAIERRSRLLAEASQWLSLSIDEMRSSNNLQNSREPLPTTEFADMLRYSNKFVLSNLLSQHTRATTDADPTQDPDSVLQSLVEQYIEEGRPKLRRDGLRLFDPRIRGEVVTAVCAELSLQPDASAAGRELKRPLTVVNIPNYTGRSHTKKLMKHVASCAEADLIHLDAQELAMLVGDYIGQDCAYSRGSISMLGYRSAEMNGRLVKSEEPSKPNDEDLSGEIEAAWVNLRDHGVDGGYGNPMDNELQKIKEGPKDYILPSVDRWENLKINAVLEEIANSATKMTSKPDRNLIIHVDDFVELNMTLEGALLIGRLRTIVDTMWRAGKRVTLVGTSSNENPSEQYASTLKEIAAEECLIPLPLNFQRITDAANTKKIYEANDFLQENLRNIQHMLKSISGQTRDTSKLRIVGVSKSSPPQFLLDDTHGSYMEVSLIPRVLATSILPLSDVYHITRLFYACEGTVRPDESWRVLFDVVESSSYSTAQLHRTQDRPTRSKPSSAGASSSADMQKPEPERLRVSGNYNDYEKKLLSGLVNSSEIKTTFADVHADAETKNNLKLLTSLSLVRPEAFTYGVLATDRIPGCLLYGPPGTGKTLLAKAVAKESGANMLEVSGASINDMYVGQSEKNVRALFSLAKKLSPLVIFIDEADALLAARGQRNRAAHRETINQFLREWDGMSDTKAFIMVATNRPFDLDDAVLRRLPRKILVDLPLKADRASILRILLKGETLDASVDVDDVARKTVLYSGSDLKNLCVAAAMTAVQEESEVAARHTGPEPYVFPPKRTLAKHHFDKALKMIAASVSEDMDSLKSIRRFDEKYGDVRAKNSQKRKGMGFGVLPTSTDAEEARVRQAVA